jgi:hypothetical protein
MKLKPQMDFPQFKKTFADLVEVLCKYPQMYTMNGTFVEIVAYLEGYTTADSKRNSRQDLNGFTKWLSARLGYSNHIVASKYLRDMYPDDAEALTEFSRLYREYADSECRNL